VFWREGKFFLTKEGGYRRVPKISGGWGENRRPSGGTRKLYCVEDACGVRAPR